MFDFITARAVAEGGAGQAVRRIAESDDRQAGMDLDIRQGGDAVDEIAGRHRGVQAFAAND